jgi:rhodanese-related sulfurtransferase
MAQVPEITVDEAQRRQTAGTPDGGAALVDVRERWEYEEVRAPGATLIPLSEFIQRYTEIPRDREALLICHTGVRSAQATKFLQRQGYERVANVSGGMEAWEAAGLAVEHGATTR